MRLRGVIGEPVDGWESVADWMAHADAGDPDVDVADDDPIQIMYTSGTESRPKGATLSSRALIAQYVSCIVDGRDERPTTSRSTPCRCTTAPSCTAS